MKSFRMRMVSKIDKNGQRYFFLTSKVPLSIDLSNTVIHFYQNMQDGDITGELVVRFFEESHSQKSLPEKKE